MNRNHLGDMMRLCSRREYCTEDIRHKLQLRQLESDSINEIIKTLTEEGYLSDSRYATAFARDKSSLQGWGSAKIKLALHRKGIDAETIKDAMTGIDAKEAAKKLKTVLEIKHKSLIKEDLRKNNCTAPDASRLYTIKNKLVRFGISRGYSIDEILASMP